MDGIDAPVGSSLGEHDRRQRRRRDPRHHRECRSRSRHFMHMIAAVFLFDDRESPTDTFSTLRGCVVSGDDALHSTRDDARDARDDGENIVGRREPPPARRGGRGRDARVAPRPSRREMRPRSPLLRKRRRSRRERVVPRARPRGVLSAFANIDFQAERDMLENAGACRARSRLPTRAFARPSSPSRTFLSTTPFLSLISLVPPPAFPQADPRARLAPPVPSPRFATRPRRRRQRAARALPPRARARREALHPLPVVSSRDVRRMARQRQPVLLSLCGGDGTRVHAPQIPGRGARPARRPRRREDSPRRLHQSPDYASHATPSPTERPRRSGPAPAPRLVPSAPRYPAPSAPSAWHPTPSARTTTRASSTAKHSRPRPTRTTRFARSRRSSPSAAAARIYADANPRHAATPNAKRSSKNATPMTSKESKESKESKTGSADSFTSTPPRRVQTLVVGVGVRGVPFVRLVAVDAVDGEETTRPRAAKAARRAEEKRIPPAVRAVLEVHPEGPPEVSAAGTSVPDEGAARRRRVERRRRRRFRFRTRRVRGRGGGDASPPFPGTSPRTSRLFDASRRRGVTLASALGRWREAVAVAAVVSDAGEHSRRVD